MPGAVLLAVRLRDRREQKNQDGDFSFPQHYAQHMPCRCHHCCSTVVPLAGCILRPTSALCKTQQRGRRHRHSALCSLPTPCIALGDHLKQISLGQAGTWPPWLSLPSVLAPRMHSEAGGPGRAAAIIPDHHARSPALGTAQLPPAGHEAVALGKSPWATPGSGCGCWQQPGEVHRESLGTLETQ